MCSRCSALSFIFHSNPNRFAISFILAFLLLPALAHGQEGQRRLPVLSEGEGKRVALVLGNAGYRLRDYKLDNSAHDAHDMAAFLRSAHFDVIEKTDLTYDEMNAVFRAFGKRLAGASVALFYYSGHGTQVRGTNYLVPTDANIYSETDVEHQCRAVDDVLDLMAKAQAPVNLVFLDACRDNPFLKSRGGVRGLAAMTAPDGMLIAYATKAGSTASDNAGSRNGLYTQELLKALPTPGLSLQDALNTTRRSVYALSGHHQLPAEYTSLLSSFTFVPGRLPESRVPDLHQYGMEPVEIPEGPFMMGTAPAEVDVQLKSHPDYQRDWFASEISQHQVYLDTYYIARNLVTVGQYKRFCMATGRSMPPAPGFNPNWSQEDHPIVNVTWDDATAYCEWLSQETGYKVTLPTEAQWEKAARGKDDRTYPWGREWDGSKCANSVDKRRSGTMPVGSYPLGASPYHVLDMAGNVWQWCSDWFDATYYKSSPDRNPQGPGSGQDRVLRGGSWSEKIAGGYRCAARRRNKPDSRNNINGFRCVVLPRP